MKKVVSLAVVLGMIFTPVSAMAQHRDYRWGVDHGGRHHSGTYNGRHRDRGVSTGEAVAIGLGALIVGAAIANNNRNTRVERVERYEYQNQPRQSQYVCQDVIQRDYYGNPYVAGRNCWYQ